jgi:tRNA (adenine-N(1)-)-methyltransferase non-catalytic subunit
MLLHMANVGSNGRVLVLEGSGGMVTGAVAERLGGRGLVCSTFVGTKAPSIDTIRLFNFAPEVRATIVRASLFKLLTNCRALRADKASKALAQEIRGNGTQDVKEEARVIAGSEGIPDADHPESNDTGMKTDVAESPNPPGDLGIPLPFTSFILNVPSINPAVALRAVLPLLVPSASFAVASATLQPLAECMHELRAAGTALNMTVQEIWMREQQMLTQRSHPFMAMNHGGGYLLSGTVTFLGTELPLVLPDEA